MIAFGLLLTSFGLLTSAFGPSYIGNYVSLLDTHSYDFLSHGNHHCDTYSDSRDAAIEEAKSYCSSHSDCGGFAISQKWDSFCPQFFSLNPTTYDNSDWTFFVKNEEECVDVAQIEDPATNQMITCAEVYAQMMNAGINWCPAALAALCPVTCGTCADSPECVDVAQIEDPATNQMITCAEAYAQIMNAGLPYCPGPLAEQCPQTCGTCPETTSQPPEITAPETTSSTYGPGCRVYCTGDWVGDNTCDESTGCYMCPHFWNGDVFDGGDCAPHDGCPAHCTDSWIGDSICDEFDCTMCPHFWNGDLFDGGDCGPYVVDSSYDDMVDSSYDDDGLMWEFNYEVYLDSKCDNNVGNVDYQSRMFQCDVGRIFSCASNGLVQLNEYEDEACTILKRSMPMVDAECFEDEGFFLRVNYDTNPCFSQIESTEIESTTTDPIHDMCEPGYKSILGHPFAGSSCATPGLTCHQNSNLTPQECAAFCTGDCIGYTQEFDHGWCHTMDSTFNGYVAGEKAFGTEGFYCKKIMPTIKDTFRFTTSGLGQNCDDACGAIEEECVEDMFLLYSAEEVASWALAVDVTCTAIVDRCDIGESPIFNWRNGECTFCSNPNHPGWTNGNRCGARWHDRERICPCTSSSFTAAPTNRLITGSPSMSQPTRSPSKSPTPAGYEGSLCNVDDDCDSARCNFSELPSRCREKESHLSDCDRDVDCESEHCLGRKCVDGRDNDRCNSNDDCQSGRCAFGVPFGKCQTQAGHGENCIRNDDCASEHCLLFTCTDHRDGAHCVNDDDCLDGSSCVWSAKGATCKKNHGCTWWNWNECSEKCTWFQKVTSTCY